MTTARNDLLQPALAIDPIVVDAAARAFDDLAATWFAGEGTNEQRAALLQAVINLGFADALPSPDGREAWLDAAAILLCEVDGTHEEVAQHAAAVAQIFENRGASSLIVS